MQGRHVTGAQWFWTILWLGNLVGWMLTDSALCAVGVWACIILGTLADMRAER